MEQTSSQWLKMMQSKHRHPARPRPEPGDFPDRDIWRAKLFGWWLKQHNITLDRFTMATGRYGGRGLSVSVVTALSGAGGKSPVCRWSTIKRETMLHMWRAVNIVQPMRIGELREMLDIPEHHAPWVWAEEEAVAGKVTASAEIAEPLEITWDTTDLRPPHVWLEPTGGYRIGGEAAPGDKRLGRLRELRPAYSEARHQAKPDSSRQRKRG